MSNNTSCAAMIAILVHNNEKKKKGKVPRKKTRWLRNLLHNIFNPDNKDSTWYFLLAVLLGIFYAFMIAGNLDKPPIAFVLSAIIIIPGEIMLIVWGVSERKKEKKRKKKNRKKGVVNNDPRLDFLFKPAGKP